MVLQWLKRLHHPTRSTATLRAPDRRSGGSDTGQPGFRAIGVVPLDMSQLITSGLSDTTESAVGHLLTFTPEAGWGWIGTPGPYACPEPFLGRLQRFFFWRGNRRGGVARIEQPNHLCDGMWVLFATRHVGVFDFSTAIEHHNVAILNTAPDDPVDDGTFWVLTEELPGLIMAGFAEISAPNT
jgi:hypothetical protein